MTQPVRARNDGEDFHLLWTARRSMRLLDKRTGLVAIKIEGCSPAEGMVGTSTAELVIDTAEYYGDEDFSRATRIEYWQLKHSTVQTDKAWNASELSETIAQFAGLYKERCRQHGNDAVGDKLRFVFLTNRPIDVRLLGALTATPRSGAQDRLLRTWRSKSGMEDVEFNTFLRLLRLDGRTPGHGEQDALLRGELAGISPRALDADLRDRLIEFVRNKTLTPAAGENGISKERLLGLFGVRSAELLFPALPVFEELAGVLPREQEAEIGRIIREAAAPVLIHAAGGVGKSILARRLPELMPPGSVSVVFDGFAGGDYRKPNQPRHLHSQGLVQIINELAQQGWCDVVLPGQDAANHDYLRTFNHRLEQASHTLRQHHPDALLLIVLDAADNSEDAARDRNEAPSFARDLLQLSPPAGCRLVVLARSERRDRFPNRCNSTIEIPLSPFSETESGRHLQQAYPEVTAGHIAEFHRYTGGNPRIQSYLLRRSSGLQELLRRLGPNGLTVDQQIREEVEAALAELRSHSGDEAGIDALCGGLASLPPRVPTSVLAQAAGVDQAAIDTFVAGLGQALVHLDGFVQFRDEPVESWFRDTFRDDHHAQATLSRLARVAETDAYVAASWPGLLFQAGKQDDLFRHALGAEPDIDDVLERRAIVRERLRFALRVAGQRHERATSTKLLLRLAELRAAEERQRDILFSNDDLIATLWPSEQVTETVFRQRAGDWYGITHARYAAMLAKLPGHQAEARQSLRQAQDWLNEWAETASEGRDRYRAQVGDIAAFASAHLYLRGERVCVEWISRWKASQFRFQIALRLAKRLIDCDEAASALELLQHASPVPHIGLGLVCGLAEIGLAPPIATLNDLAAKWAAMQPEREESFQADGAMTVAQGLVILGEVMAHGGLDARVVLDHVTRFLPEIPKHARVDVWDFQHSNQDLFIRAYCLRAELTAIELKPEDLLPDSLKRVGQPITHNGEVERFQRVYGQLLPWYRLRAEVLLQRLSASELSRRLQELAATGKHQPYDWQWRQDATFWANHIIQLWWGILNQAGAATVGEAPALETWLERVGKMAFITTWISLVRLSAHAGQAELALHFAALVEPLLRESHDDADSDAKDWLDLARAVLPASRDDARVYFEQGLEILEGRLGQESRDWFESLRVLASRAGKPGMPQPELAYRLARAAEQVHEHNSHKFNWEDVAETLAKLCPTSALALAGRWEDRRRAYLNDTLAGTLSTLVRIKAISSGQALALRYLTNDWNRDQLLDACLEQEGDRTRKADLLEQMVDELAFAPPDHYATEKLLSVAKRHGLVSTRLEALLAQPPDVETRRQLEDRDRYSARKPERDAPEPMEGDFTQTAEIDRVMTAWHEDRGQRSRDEVIRAMLDTIPVAKRIEHLRAWYEADAVAASDVLFVYQDILKDWNNPAVRKEVEKLTAKLIGERAGELLDSGFSVGFLLGRRWGERPGKLDVDLGPFLDAAAQQAGTFSAAPFFQLTQELALQLSPDEASQVLDFALNRMEAMQVPDTGDGEWRQELAPPENMVEAVAGLLWARLAAPEAEARWRAAHAVRCLCRFGEQATLDALIARIGMDDGGAFADGRLPFYDLHAQLYLLIALARITLESPSILRPHATLFSRMACEGLPHVLMRHFAAMAALALEMAFPGTYVPEVLEALGQVNRSTVSSSKKQLEQSQGKQLHIERHHFYLDIEPYWFQPLASVFGVPVAEVTNRAVPRIDGFSHSMFSRDSRSSHYQDTEALLYKDSYPRTDPLDFYLAYHAMFYVAGDLLAMFPVQADSYDDSPFDSWLINHLLTRSDGEWLADRRDPRPLHRRPWQGESDSEFWRWAITRQDFDTVMGIEHGLPNWLPIWGEWHFSDGFRSETVSVASALVRESNAGALVHKLQTDGEPHLRYLPSVREYGDEFNFPVLRSWVFEPSPTEGLDRFDPFGGRLPYPTAMPGFAIRRMLHLQHDKGYRTWRVDNGNGPITFKAELWGDRTNERGSRRPEYGSMLAVDSACLCELLARLRRNLILEVRISRDSSWSARDSGDEHLYPPPYVRFFQINSQGIVSGI